MTRFRSSVFGVSQGEAAWSFASATVRAADIGPARGEGVLDEVGEQPLFPSETSLCIGTGGFGPRVRTVVRIRSEDS